MVTYMEWDEEAATAVTYLNTRLHVLRDFLQAQVLAVVREHPSDFVYNAELAGQGQGGVEAGHRPYRWMQWQYCKDEDELHLVRWVGIEKPKSIDRSVTDVLLEYWRIYVLVLNILNNHKLYHWSAIDRCLSYSVLVQLLPQIFQLDLQIVMHIMFSVKSRDSTFTRLYLVRVRYNLRKTFHGTMGIIDHIQVGRILLLCTLLILYSRSIAGALV